MNKGIHIIIKRTAVFGIFFAVLLASHLLAGQQNHALHFDGQNDYVTLNPIAGLSPNSSFTVQMWFRASSSGIPCNGNFRRLFVLSSAQGVPFFSRFEVGECGGDLRVFWSAAGGSSPVYSIPLSGILTDGNWHHLTVVKTNNASNTNAAPSIYVDCVLVWPAGMAVPIIPPLNTELFRLGHWHGSTTPNQDWHGEMDEVVLWNMPLSTQQITQSCGPCVLTGDETGLVTYWRFDQGAPGGNNTVITTVTDYSPVYSNQGALSSSGTVPPGFTLNGPASNFVTSTSPLIYPFYQNYEVVLSDLQQNPGLQEICSGSPVHFSIANPLTGPQAPAAGANVSVVWHISDDGGGTWSVVPVSASAPAVFGSFNFGAPPNHSATSIDCSANTTGYVDRLYRAVISVADPALGTACIYTAESSPLRIYCPVGSPVMTVAPAGPLCEGGVVSFTASLNLPQMSSLQINWSILVAGVQSNLTGPSYDNLTSITHPPTGTLILGPDDITFMAVISNGNCPGAVATATITVDALPVCGTIAGSPHANPTNLVQISANPLVYEICPDTDAAVEIVTPFLNCLPIWQYMFPSVGVWQDLGTSNAIQNTNVLPHLRPANSPYLWPAGETCIEYRIECRPLSWPNSPCAPCHSNTVRICLAPDPDMPVISGTTPICKGSSSLLSVAPVQPGIVPQWYHNGILVATGQSYVATRSGCYWVLAVNSCGRGVTSDMFCLEVCESVAVISCPVPDCPCVGNAITLSAANSYSTCGGPLTYAWSWNSGTLVSDNGISLEHIPAPGGTVYTLTVTDAYGCSATTQTTVVPCVD